MAKRNKHSQSGTGRKRKVDQDGELVSAAVLPPFVVLQEHLLGALWLLLSDEDNVDDVLAMGAVELVADVLRLREPKFGRAIHMSIGAMFFLSNVR